MSTLNDPSFISCNMSQGCPVPVGNGTCGESNSLEIMKEFNKLYEERMDQIDGEAGGDCSQEKIKLQQEWIKNLMQQNEMLVTAVQELEYEATERVRQLEEKLHKSAQCLCEGEKMLNEKERTVQELTQRLNYYGSFGDVEGMAKELRCKREECESLKQEMADMRQALTEEVAAKHDQIVLLKKDLQIFEDRCMQADKQTAFKEDIIRELRKEIKQLKQQFTHDEISKLNTIIEELQNNLEKTRLVQNEEELAHQNEILQLNETITKLQQEIKSMEEKYEQNAKTCKICRGRSKVGFLETSEVQADLESADSSLVKILNDTKTKMKTEIDKRNGEIQALKNKIADLESALCSCEERASNLQEAEQLKKLAKQKKCYEEVISYFKQEMGVMAEQLSNLQDLLTLSNETSQQETSRIMTAFMEVQSLNERLSTQLGACEQKVQLENQMNQIHEARICELQQLVNEKEMDLSKHDQAVLNIRKTLNDSLRQNEDLQNTIVDLNATIASLQDALKRYEYENCASKKSCQEFQEQIGGYSNKLQDLKKNLDEKTAECLKLEMAYNNEKRALKAAQKQLQETERLQQENRMDLVNSLEDMKHKLMQKEEANNKLCQECETLQGQLANLSRKEAVKDLEIKRYRKIVGDLKSTMTELNTELNKNLAHKDLRNICKEPTCRLNADTDMLQDICLSCPCEVEFYQQMVGTLKQSITELKRKLTDAEQKNRNLEDDLQRKDAQLGEFRNLKEELNQKLLQLEAKDKIIADQEREIDRLNQEIQVRSLQLTDVKKSANEINGSKCVQLACAQEEIANLKNEMANLLNRQYILKKENEELQAQTAQLRCTISCLNEKNKMSKEQVDQHLMKIKSLATEKDALLRKNKELLTELRSIQSMGYSSEKQQRELPRVQQRVSSTSRPRCKANRQQAYGSLCTSPCSLGSQGAASYYDGESPPPSPDFLNNEWYSPTFRTESDNDSEEEYCVNTLENLTQQMRNSNRIWTEEKKSRRDCRVTKDVKQK